MAKLSKQALNKIVKGLVDDRQYRSATYNKMKEAQAKYDEARAALLSETETVVEALRDHLENQKKTRAYKKLPEQDQNHLEYKYDELDWFVRREVCLEAGYDSEGYDLIENNVWNGSSC